MATFGLQMMSIGGVAILVARASEFFLGRVQGPAALGLYTRASTVGDTVFGAIYGTATKVVFTKLAKDFRERGEIAETFLASLQMIFAVMWPLMVGVAILARPGVYLLYGERWLPAALPLSLLMASQVLTLSFGMNWELFALRGEMARQTRLELIRSVIGLVSFAAGAALFGIAGAAAGWVVASLFGLVVYYPHLIRLAEISPGRLHAIYGQGVVLTAAATGPALVLMLTHNWSPSTSPLWIAASVAAGGGLWLIAMGVLRHPLLAEMHNLMRRRQAAPL
jgi:O-antigen/teichoic acid export membrane protein